MHSIFRSATLKERDDSEELGVCGKMTQGSFRLVTQKESVITRAIKTRIASKVPQISSIFHSCSIDGIPAATPY
jgi:hypothetical protein